MRPCNTKLQSELSSNIICIASIRSSEGLDVRLQDIVELSK